MSTFFDWDVLDDWFSDVEDWFSDVINTVITWIKDAIEWTSRLIHKFIEYVNDWIDIIKEDLEVFFRDSSAAYKREVFLVRADRPIYDNNGKEIIIRDALRKGLISLSGTYDVSDYIKGIETSIENNYVGIVMLEYEDEKLVGYKMYDAGSQSDHDRILKDIDKNGGVLKLGTA